MAFSCMLLFCSCSTLKNDAHLYACLAYTLKTILNLNDEHHDFVF